MFFLILKILESYACGQDGHAFVVKLAQNGSAICKNDFGSETTNPLAIALDPTDTIVYGSLISNTSNMLQL